MQKFRNLLILQSDQHRRDWMGCAGARFVHTPNLDALAARGVRFNQTSCTYPLCGPSRMSFLTGRHPFRNGLFTNEESLPSHLLTYAHALGLGGYHTVLCGRMHFSGPDQRHGFHQRVFGDFNPTYAGGPKSPEIYQELRQASVGRRPSIESARTLEEHYFLDFDEGVASAAEEFLAKWSAQGEGAAPLMLNVGFFLPHSPFNAPKKYVDRVRARAAEDARWLMPIPRRTPEHEHPWETEFQEHQKTRDLQPADFREVRIQYAALIEYLDERIGRVLKAAEALPGDTLVVYHSDHGESAGDLGMLNKGCLLEGSIGVPMIWAPLDEPSRREGFPAGAVVEAPVSLVDLLPTFVDLAGLDFEFPPMDGHSLTAFFHQDTLPTATSAAMERLVFAEMEFLPQRFPPVRTVRRGYWKYIHFHGFGPDQLFNLADDPEELHNLAGDPAQAKNVEELRALALTGWNPDQLHKEARAMDAQKWILDKWGREIGRPQWGFGEVWPGKKQEHEVEGPWTRSTWQIPPK